MSDENVNRVVHCFSKEQASHREVLCKVTDINSTSNEARFKELMQSNEPSVVEALSNLLKVANNIRKNHQEQ